MNKLFAVSISIVGLLVILLLVGFVLSVNKCSTSIDNYIEENKNNYPYVAHLEGKNYYFYSSKVENNIYYLYDKDNNLLCELIVGIDDSIAIKRR